MGATIALLLVDFLQRGAATLQKITFLARPVGATEIFIPVLTRTVYPVAIAQSCREAIIRICNNRF